MKKLLVSLFLVLVPVLGLMSASAQAAGGAKHFDDKIMYKTTLDARIPSCLGNEALTYLAQPPASCPVNTTPCTSAPAGCACTDKNGALTALPPPGAFACAKRDKMKDCAVGEVLTSSDGINYTCVAVVPNCTVGQLVSVDNVTKKFTCINFIPSCAAGEFVTSDGTKINCKSIASIATCGLGEYLTSDGTQLYCAPAY